MRVKDTESFINKSISVHGRKYDYSSSMYADGNTKVKIICPDHGEFYQIPETHFSGCGCRICGQRKPRLSNDLIKEIESVFPNLRVIGKCDKNVKKINVIDENGIIYNVYITGIRNGAYPTIQSAVNKNYAFEIKARNIHGDKYSYELINYTNCFNSIDIICKIHGVFSQCPASHMGGSGCPACGNDIVSAKLSKTPSGWGLSDWTRAGSKSNGFDGYKLYIIKAFNDNESFIKIGRTFQKISKRFTYGMKFPYKYDILYCCENSPYKIYNLETKLKREYKSFKMIPSIPFCGMQECFSMDLLPKIKEYINGNT